MKKIQSLLNKYWVELGVVLAGWLLFIPTMVSGRALFWGTPVLQFIPWRETAWKILAQGGIPLWNFYNGMGSPLAANYQLALFYPPGWISYLFAWLGGLPWLAWSQTLILALHFSWMGLGMVRWLRRRNIRSLGSAIGGLAFMLSGYFTARTQFFPILWAAAWLPWLLIAVDQIVDKTSQDKLFTRESARATGWFAVCVAMLLLAGHAQTAWYSLLLAGFWLLIQLGEKKIWKERWHGFVIFSLGTCIGILLAMIQLLPTAEYLQYSQRSDAVSYEAAMTYSFWPWHVLNFLSPEFFGHPATGDFWGQSNFWEDAVYLGILPFLFALFTFPSLFKLKKFDFESSRLRIFCWCLIGVSILLALGWYTPVFPFLYRNIPTFDMFQAPARFLIWTVWGISVLAAIGLDAIAPADGKKLYWLRLGTAGMGAITIGSFLAWTLMGDVKMTFIRAMAGMGVFALGTGGLALSVPKPDTVYWKKAIWNFLVIFWTCIDLMVASYRLSPSVPMDFYQVQKDFSETGRTYLSPKEEYLLKFDRYFKFEDFQSDMNWNVLWDSQLPNINLLFGVESVNLFDPLQPAHYIEWMENVASVSQQERPLWLQFMGVGTILRTSAVSPSGVRLDKLSGGSEVWFSSCAQSTKDVDVWNQIKTERIPHPSESCVFLDDGIDLQENPQNSTSNFTINDMIMRSQSIQFNVTTDTGGWFEWVETWYPGWIAKVDGTAQKIYRADTAFMAIALEPGTHQILFEYQPLSFILGTICTLAAGVFWFIWMLLHRSVHNISKESQEWNRQP